jgi:ribosome-associated protein
MATRRKAPKKTTPRKQKKAVPRKSGAPRRRVVRKPSTLEPPTPEQAAAAQALAKRIANLVLDKKAQDVTVLDVRGLTSYADFFVLASGESERQVSSMAEHVHTALKHEGRSVVGREGEQSGSWVLLDYGEVVAHLFLQETRAFYDLEGLWADAPRERVV